MGDLFQFIGDLKKGDVRECKNCQAIPFTILTGAGH